MTLRKPVDASASRVAPSHLGSLQRGAPVSQRRFDSDVFLYGTGSFHAIRALSLSVDSQSSCYCLYKPIDSAPMTAATQLRLDPRVYGRLHSPFIVADRRGVSLEDVIRHMVVYRDPSCQSSGEELWSADRKRVIMLKAQGLPTAPWDMDLNETYVTEDTIQARIYEDIRRRLRALGADPDEDSAHPNQRNEELHEGLFEEHSYSSSQQGEDEDWYDEDDTLSTVAEDEESTWSAASREAASEEVPQVVEVSWDSENSIRGDVYAEFEECASSPF